MVKSKGEQDIIDALEARAAEHGIDIVDVEVVGATKAPCVRVRLDKLEGDPINLDEVTAQTAWVSETVEALDQIRADLAFIGTNGITLDHGLSTPDRTEAAVKRAIIERARLVVVLADASKIGVERTIKFAEVSAIDTLVTDKEITTSDRRSFERAGVEVIAV